MEQIKGLRQEAPVLLIASYVTDWIIIVVAVGLAGVFYTLTPNKRPFSVVDPSISFPYGDDTISTSTLFLTSFVAPVIIIFFVTLFLVPGPTVPKSTPKGLIWRRKLWELHTGWLGLALSLASTLFITFGMKNLFGKPRPDLIARCNPDLSNISRFVVGGINMTGVGERSVLVNHLICQNQDESVMNDGFSSFPSGHSSFSSAGLVYLSIFLASKLAVTFPFLAPSGYNQSKLNAFPSREQPRPLRGGPDRIAEGHEGVAESPSGHDDAMIAARNQAAAPPLYLLVIVLVPFLSAVYISSTRWSDFRHHGFDILFGVFIGTVASIFAFRYYHLPMNQGAGWSWGPRSKDRAFWAGVGVGNYVGQREASSVVRRDEEIEFTTMSGADNGQVGRSLSK